MKMTYESLRKFARENGDIKLFAPNKGEIIILKDGTPDLFDVIEKATTFIFHGKEYNRADFEKVLEKSK